MNLKNIFLFIIISHYVLFPQQEELWGVITIPVADMVLHPSEKYKRNSKAEEFFKNLPLFATYNSKPSCPRAHQGLFNERVKILETLDDQVCIEIPTLFYGIDEKTQQPLRKFWTLKEWVMPLSELSDQQIKGIPYLKRVDDASVLTLLQPFYDKEQKTIYSFGTRFTRTPKKDTEHCYAVRINDFKNNSLYHLLIPKNFCLIETSLTSQLDDLLTRVKIASSPHADLFISLHLNATTFHPEVTRGFEIYVPMLSDFPVQSYLLASFIHHAFSQKTEPEFRGNLGNLNKRDRGIRAAKFNVIFKVPCPAVLIECDYLTHPEVEKLYKTEEYQNLIAHNIAEAILQYLNYNHNYLMQGTL